MKRLIPTSCFLAFVAMIAFLALPGCQRTTTPAKDATAKEKKDKKDHDHPAAGPHGGPFAEWDDIYHAEFTADHANKKAIVYILDDKVKNTPKIDPKKITKVKLTIKATPPITIDLTHDSNLSGELGFAFTGDHDFFAKPSEFSGTIDGTVDGKQHSGDFTYKPADKTKTAALRDLYLKPGGIYTAADIKANGNMLPAEKFAGREWKHDEDLKPGDKFCPISKSKAEADCNWVVQGQRYEFCCTPCVDRFIRYAHFEPSKIKDAKDYVQRGN